MYIQFFEVNVTKMNNSAPRQQILQNHNVGWTKALGSLSSPLLQIMKCGDSAYLGKSMPLTSLLEKKVMPIWLAAGNKGMWFLSLFITNVTHILNTMQQTCSKLFGHLRSKINK